jgi:formate dehydrogenase subunit gamma
MYTLGGFSTGYRLILNFQVSAVEAEWHDLLMLLGLAAVGMTILGLLLNYFIARNIKPARELREDKEAPEVERYRKPTRILHWVCASAFIILFFTGILLVIPNLKDWAQDGWPNILHLVASVIFIAAPLIYTALNWKTTLKGIKYALTWGKEDLDWVKAAPQYYYLGNEQVMPPQGYLNTFQKMWLLLVIVSWLVFAISGLIMWAFKTIAPTELLQFMTFLHDVAFIITGTMFFVHIYLSLVHPMMRPLKAGAWSAITRGKVSAEYAKSHHGKWYQEISRT